MMALHYEYRTVSHALPIILSDLIEYGDEVGSRNGRVMEILNPQIVITNPTQREVLSLNRRANVFAQIAETVWVLSGRNDVEWLSAYLPRAKDFSDDGETWRGGYGPRIRRWTLFNGDRLDQLAHVVDVLHEDPLSRRAVIAIYDPAVDTEPGRDIPCNDFLQFQSRLGKLHMTVTVRSNDVMWGWSGINAFEWSTLQEIVASLLGIEVGPLTFNIGSLHLYEHHWEKARAIEPENQTFLTKFPFNPDRAIETVADLDLLFDQFFAWEKLCRQGEATLEMLDDFTDPLFRAWASAIAYYWQRGTNFYHPLAPSALGVAIARTPASLLPEPVGASQPVTVAPAPTATTQDPQAAFLAFVKDLHAKKHASYGDSWKKRGEMLSILPNIARKIDRLGVGDEFDSQADTYIDLWVYLAKYYCWLKDQEADPGNVDPLLDWALRNAYSDDPHTRSVVDVFNRYADKVGEYETDFKVAVVKDLMRRVGPMAFDQWYIENEYKGADVD